MALVYTEVEVDVDLSEFDDDELVEEIKTRGLESEFSSYEHDEDKVYELLNAIWINKRLGKPYATEVDQLLYETLGKII